MTNEELENKKNAIHQKRIENFMEKGVQILENSVKIRNKDSGWEIWGSFLLEEKIGVGRELEQAEAEMPALTNSEKESERQDERSGDNH